MRFKISHVTTKGMARMAGWSCRDFAAQEWGSTFYVEKNRKVSATKREFDAVITTTKNEDPSQKSPSRIRFDELR